MKYEDILSYALSRVDDKYSKRQDSAIFNGIAPACYEIAKVYEQMEYNLRQSFGVSADGVYLDNLAKEIGIDRFKATYAIKKAEFFDNDGIKVDVPIGARFAKDEYSFVVSKKLDIGVYEMIAEQSGSIVNSVSGSIMPIDNMIVSISSAMIVQNVYMAVDDETDEQLRFRYLQKVREPATSGNVYHYKRWAMEVEGVGNSKIFPLFAGGGTVKVMIVDSNFGIADSGLVQKVKEHIETVRPIGATVTVSTVTNKDISITGRVSISLNADIESVKADFRDRVRQYIEHTVKEYFSSVDTDGYSVSLAQIGKILLESKAVVDYSELKLNSAVSNVVIGSEQIPNISSIQLEVIG